MRVTRLVAVAGFLSPLLWAGPAAAQTAQELWPEGFAKFPQQGLVYATSARASSEWEGCRVDFAARKKGAEKWFHEALGVDRRLDEGGTPIGEWELSSAELHYSLEILPNHIDE